MSRWRTSSLPLFNFFCLSIFSACWCTPKIMTFITLKTQYIMLPNQYEQTEMNNIDNTDSHIVDIYVHIINTYTCYSPSNITTFDSEWQQRMQGPVCWTSLQITLQHYKIRLRMYIPAVRSNWSLLSADREKIKRHWSPR